MTEPGNLRWAAVGLVAGTILGGAGIYLALRPPAPEATTPAPTAAPSASLAPPVTTPAPVTTLPIEVAEVRPASPPPVAKTTAPGKPPQVVKLITEAGSAASANKYEEAAGLYDKALELDPRNPQAQAGRSSAVAAAALQRSFALGTSEVDSRSPSAGDLAGFEAKDIGVKRAPVATGRVELEVLPAKVKPGDPYNVHVFLLNEDPKKEINIQAMKVSMLADGKWTSVPLTPLAKDVGPRKKQLVAELPGVWKDGLASWALEVTITSKRQDIYKNRVTWQ